MLVGRFGVSMSVFYVDQQKQDPRTFPNSVGRVARDANSIRSRAFSRAVQVGRIDVVVAMLELSTRWISLCGECQI